MSAPREGPGIVRLADPAAAARWSAAERVAGRTIGFVPTMGALHEGHLTLVRRAAAENDVACASVFVNPLQFDDPADLARYPRDFAGDAGLLEGAGCAMVFTGTLAGFFPGAADPAAIRRRDPGPAAAGLEGACRPGHFAGVVTIVERLFAAVRPRAAYFGEKDFQQCLVVRDLARSLGYPEIVLCPTSRDPDGLARSSRNAFLGAAERARALALSRALFAARAAWARGLRDAGELEALLRARLAEPGIEIEYAAVRDPARWSADPPPGRLAQARALVAARVGRVRLIDNLALDEPDPAGEAAG
ncbi:MAG: pantoate--beta-alanine ligase [Planctomycetota bacterium]